MHVTVRSRGSGRGSGRGHAREIFCECVLVLIPFGLILHFMRREKQAMGGQGKEENGDLSTATIKVEAKSYGNPLHDGRDNDAPTSFQVGDVVDISTEDGWERGAVVLGPSSSGDSSELRVKFADGVVDDWPTADFRET